MCRVLSIAHHPVPALRGKHVELEDSLSSKKVEAHSPLTKEEMLQGKKASERVERGDDTLWRCIGTHIVDAISTYEYITAKHEL